MSGAAKLWRIGLPVTAMLLAALAIGGTVWVQIQERALAEQRLLVRELSRQLELAQRRDSAPAPAPSTWELPDQPDVTGLLQELATIGAESGVQLSEARPLPPATPGRQSFKLAGRGTPAAVCSFVAGTESAGSLFVLESGSIQPASDDELAFEVAVATFHRRAGGR